VAAPRLWFSRRWRLAVLSSVALLITTAQRLSLDLALTSMLNQTTAASANPRDPTISLLRHITAPPLNACV